MINKFELLSFYHIDFGKATVVWAVSDEVGVITIPEIQFKSTLKSGKHTFFTSVNLKQLTLKVYSNTGLLIGEQSIDIDVRPVKGAFQNQVKLYRPFVGIDLARATIYTSAPVFNAKPQLKKLSNKKRVDFQKPRIEVKKQIRTFSKSLKEHMEKVKAEVARRKSDL